mmetsp:Transcript_20854/g.54481  ORF Transcript_20854/g.54481 Transcript_20854/m.54481 type:complete len:112 (+) Transcript_20854:494-829(+)
MGTALAAGLSPCRYRRLGKWNHCLAAEKLLMPLLLLLLPRERSVLLLPALPVDLLQAHSVPHHCRRRPRVRPPIQPPSAPLLLGAPGGWQPPPPQHPRRHPALQLALHPSV